MGSGKTAGGQYVVDAPRCKAVEVPEGATFFSDALMGQNTTAAFLEGLENMKGIFTTESTIKIMSQDGNVVFMNCENKMRYSGPSPFPMPGAPPPNNKEAVWHSSITFTFDSAGKIKHVDFFMDRICIGRLGLLETFWPLWKMECDEGKDIGAAQF